jgi:tetratricopeptide (TPR) repeat protein
VSGLEPHVEEEAEMARHRISWFGLLAFGVLMGIALRLVGPFGSGPRMAAGALLVGLFWLLYRRSMEQFAWSHYLCLAAAAATVFYSGQLAGRHSLRLHERAVRTFQTGLPHEALGDIEDAKRYAYLGFWPFLRDADRAGAAQLLVTRAAIRLNLGDYDAPLADLERAVALCARSGDRNCLMSAHLNLGSFLGYVDPHAAERHFLAAREAGEGVRDLATEPGFELWLADLAIRTRDYEAAERHLDRAAALSAEPDPLVLFKRAELLLARGSTDEAARLVAAAADLRSPPRAALGPTWQSYPELSTDLHLRTGRFEDAAEMAIASHPIGVFQLTDRRGVVRASARLAWAQEGLGRREEAVARFLACVELLEKERLQLPPGARLHLLDQDVFAVPHRHLATLLAQWPAGEPMPPQLERYGRSPVEAALHFAESAKARSHLETLAAAGALQAGRFPAPDASRERELRGQLEQAQRRLERAMRKGGFTKGGLEKRSDGSVAYRTSDAPPAVEAALRARERVESEWRRFEDELYRTAPRYAAVRYPRPLPSSAIPLAADEIAIEFALSDFDSVAFRLEKGRPPRAFTIPATRNELGARARAFLAPLADRHAAPSAERAAELSALLFAEVLAGVPPGTKLVVVPDGSLWTLPIELLPVPGATTPGELVGERWSVSLAPSLSVLALNRMVPALAPPAPFFGLADPTLPSSRSAEDGDAPFVLRGIYVDRSRYELPPLPETRQEVAAAAAALGVAARGPHLLFGSEASELQVKRSPLANYRILHLAAHGIAANDVAGMREPALVLAAGGTEDGLLRASEIVGLELGSSLVVLAACKTGLGEEIGGEGVKSLAWSFQQAGARTVVMSLWSVPSRETSELFEAFYARLARGTSAGESLRQAKLELRRSHPEPFSWAGFVLAGESDWVR